MKSVFTPFKLSTMWPQNLKTAAEEMWSGKHLLIVKSLRYASSFAVPNLWETRIQRKGVILYILLLKHFFHHTSSTPLRDQYTHICIDNIITARYLSYGAGNLSIRIHNLKSTNKTAVQNSSENKKYRKKQKKDFEALEECLTRLFTTVAAFQITSLSIYLVKIYLIKRSLEEDIFYYGTVSTIFTH